MTTPTKRKRKGVLCGVGLDRKDEHFRLTRGPNFVLVGGSQPTHELMTEKVIKFNEHLKKRGKTLEMLSQNEFHDIAREIGLKTLDKKNEEN